MLELLSDLKNKLQMYTVQRDQAQLNFQQLVGAIFVLSDMIAELEKQATDTIKEESPPNGEPDAPNQLPSAE